MSTAFAPDPDDNAWIFIFFNGQQDDHFYTSTHYAWAVQSGNVGIATVPIPATLWLFGSGLLGLIGIARKKAA